MPISYDIFEIGKFYAYIQTILSYNKANSEDFYQIDKYQVKENEILFFNKIYPYKYKNKFITSFIPRNCDLVEENSINTYPNSYTKFTCPKNQKIGYGELVTHISKQIYDKKNNNGIPQYLMQFINKKQRIRIKHIDLSKYAQLKNSGQGEKNEIFIYTLVKVNVNHFFKLIVETLAGPASLSVIRSGLIRVIEDQSLWSNLTIENLCDMIQGKSIRIADVEEFPLNEAMLKLLSQSQNSSSSNISQENHILAQ